jgi:uncharacterized membrane protein
MSSTNYKWRVHLKKLVTYFPTYRSASLQKRQARLEQRRDFWEVDTLRSVAIVMMVVYHFMYDLYYFRISNAIFTHPFWHYFQRIDASTFILLVGISLSISHTRAAKQGATGQALTGKFVQRGLLIFGWGLVLTLATWLFLGPQMAIKFGILHFIGVSVAISYPFLRRRRFNLALGIILLLSGQVLKQYTFSWPWLLWLGLEPANHMYVDYFPLIPWFGVVLIGIFLGNTLYTNNVRRFPLPNLSHMWPVRLLQRLGQHSLTIYLVHQPILFAILIPLLWLWTLIKGWF